MLQASISDDKPRWIRIIPYKIWTISLDIHLSTFFSEVSSLFKLPAQQWKKWLVQLFS